MSLDIDVSHPGHMRVRFTLDPAHPAGEVSVVGSFNGWTAGLDALQPDDSGTRSVMLGLAYDERHTFRYLGPGSAWFDEPDADEVTTDGSILHPRTFAERAAGLHSAPPTQTAPDPAM